MESVDVRLKAILESETSRIRESYSGNEVIFGLIEIIRSLDYQTFMLGHHLKPDDRSLLEKYKLGWSVPFLSLYRDLVFDTVPVYAFLKDSEEWADSVIQYGGSIQLCNQLLAYERADLMELQSNGDKSFTFSYLINHSYEVYEQLSLAYYHDLMNKILEEKTKSLMEKLPEIRNELQNIVKLMYEKFISYQATEKVDDFYSQFGYLYMMTTQTIDEFDQTDIFGGYSYKEYLDVAESIFKAGIMHRDCCMALAEKTSHKVYLRNILTYFFPLENYIHSYSNYLRWETDKLRQILSCFVLKKENYLYHLSYPKASPSPYFELGNGMWARSTFGCLDKPVFFLNRELKRKFPKDYFNAVNNREARFRKQLYDFFNQDRIIKIHKSIIIKTDNSSTDIDATIFDNERNVLGLFQLKWQDTFSTSMKERFSRITNLIPKSVEWIDKIERWLKNTDAKTILKTLQVRADIEKINDIYLFVVSRNHVHFSNQHLDERAVWASWYQIIEASAKIKDPLNSNPIGEFAAKLKFFSPSFRKETEDSYKIEDYSFKFADYEISIKSYK